MQLPHGRIAWNNNVGVVAEPLQAAVPNITVDIIVHARGNPKKFDVPNSSQEDPEDNDSPRKP
jgi:hypothetical protein